MIRANWSRFLAAGKSFRASSLDVWGAAMLRSYKERGIESRLRALIWRSAALAILAVAACVPVVIFPVAAQQPNDRAHQIGAKLKCMCGGCDQSAGGCYHTGGAFSGPCDTAKGMLREISARINQGQSEQQILQGFEQQFGTEVFIEPPKHGFSLVAWIMPFAYLAGGTLIVIFVISRWSKRPRRQVATTSGPAVSPEYLARARAESERETDV